MTVPPWVREVAKAIAAFLAALAAGLVSSGASGGVDPVGAVVAVIGALGTGLLTFAVPNATPTGRRRDIPSEPLDE